MVVPVIRVYIIAIAACAADVPLCGYTCQAWLAASLGAYSITVMALVRHWQNGWGE